MKKLTFVLIFCLLITACGPGEMFGPTLTPTPTQTSTPTLTPTPLPTSTSTPSATPSPTATLSCSVKNGKWTSNEKTDGFLPGPILTFVVKDCKITTIEIWSYPAPGELYMAEIAGPLTIVDNKFTLEQDDGGGVYTFEGTFDSETSSHGVLFFPKGFNVFGTILPNDVTINWTAKP